MSSATSTKGGDIPLPAASPDSPIASRRRADDGLRPWQFFVLAALGSATAVTWMARSHGVTAVVLLTILMGGAALAGLATYFTVLPLVTPDEERTAMIGQRTRAALEREKMLTLRAIKELEFDRAMKKLSDEDFREMGAKLRSRAARLMRQLDAGSGYREKVERDLAKRLGERPAGTTQGEVPSQRSAAPPQRQEQTASESDAAVRICAGCARANDPDARFCKECGAKL